MEFSLNFKGFRMIMDVNFSEKGRILRAPLVGLRNWSLNLLIAQKKGGDVLEGMT